MASRNNKLYGNNYKACPCAQIAQRDTAYTNLERIEATCCSPKRAFPCKISKTDYDQTRICAGGTAKGKRYTSCPYYVKNANVKRAGVVRKSTLGGLLTNLIMPVLFGYVALMLIKQGGTVSVGAGIFFAILAVVFFLPIITPRDYIQGRKKKGKKKR